MGKKKKKNREGTPLQPPPAHLSPFRPPSPLQARHDAGPASTSTPTPPPDATADPAAATAPSSSTALTTPAVPRWRQRERTKTTAAALVLCLNIGVDPPDAVRVPPCARLECWVDPGSMAPPKALETIGQALQAQYERWQPRARYRLHLDPTADDVRKLATSARRAARGERVLFHYNGHGVPRPTPNGEVWVFNRAYTQYIPLSVYDLQAWVGSPAVYVLDCSGAGLVAAAHGPEVQRGGPGHAGARV